MVAGEKAKVNRNTSRAFYTLLREKLMYEWADKRRSPCQMQIDNLAIRINLSKNLIPICGVYVHAAELHLCHHIYDFEIESLYPKTMYSPALVGCFCIEKTNTRRDIFGVRDLQFITCYSTSLSHKKETSLAIEFMKSFKRDFAHYRGIKFNYTPLFFTEALWRFNIKSIGNRIRNIYTCIQNDVR